MTLDDALRIVRLRWLREGRCATCGVHAALDHYTDLPAAVRIDEGAAVIALPCPGAGGAQHIGIRIRYAAPVASPTSEHLRSSISSIFREPFA